MYATLWNHSGESMFYIQSRLEQNLTFLDSDRAPWYPTFREQLKKAEDVNAIEDLVRQNQRESGETGATKPVKGSNLLDLNEDDAVNFGLGFLD